MEKIAKVAVLDSGAGGLSVAKKIMERDIPVEIFYLADLARFPYGIIDEDVLLVRLESLVKKTLAVHKPEFIIIACNTASTVVLDRLRARWPGVHFIGVVPAIKPAAKQSLTRQIAILSTEGTAKRPYLQDLIDTYAQGNEVHVIASQYLVDYTEHFLKYSALPKADSELCNLVNSLKPYPMVDTVVLACTHFPILRPFIEAKLQPLQIRCVDSTEAIVNRLVTLLQEDYPSCPTELESEFVYEITVINTGPEPLEHYARYAFQKTNSAIKFEVSF